jgi:hypothetical protein
MTVVVILRCLGAQRRNRMGHARQVPATLWRPWRHERSFLMQPIRDLALRAVCHVKFLAKGIAIRIVTFLASHPAKPLSRLCGA